MERGGDGRAKLELFCEKQKKRELTGPKNDADANGHESKSLYCPETHQASERDRSQRRRGGRGGKWGRWPMAANGNKILNLETDTPGHPRAK